MRILHVITSVDPAGGGPIEGVTQLYRALQATHHTAEIASLDAPDAPYVAGCPLPVHALGPRRGGYGYAPRALPWLRAHRRSYDVVIVEGIWQYGSLAAWRALKGTDTPYWVFTHGMLDPWFKRTYPLKHLKKSLYWPAEYRVLRDARGVCFTCEEERILARQSFRPYRVREKVVNYGTGAPPNNVEAQCAAFEMHFPHLCDKRVVLFLGRLHPKKGCDLLLEAFARIADDDPTLHLVMAGPDQVGWQVQLQERASQMGIAQRVTWPGMLQGDLKWGLYRRAELFLLPSHQENFGITVAEALACGLPVLISNKVNIWREIEKDEAGFVAEDTAQGTTDSLRRWLALSEEERRAMSRRARACFESRFEIHQSLHNLLTVLHENRLAPHSS